MQEEFKSNLVEVRRERLEHKSEQQKSAVKKIEKLYKD